MKDHFFQLCFIFILLMACVSCGSDAPAEPGTPAGTTYKVLFIGNSYTSVNNLPALFDQIATSKGYIVETTMVAPGGYRFLDHAANATTLNTITSDQWDFVILQNQSQVPGWKPVDVTALSLPHAVTLADTIKANKADTEIIYYVTWGRENGDAGYCGYYTLVCDFDGHTAALLTGYGIYHASTGDILGLVGSAWKAVVDDAGAPFASGDLWQADESHPELLGSYLAANVLFAAAFKESSLGADSPASISAANAAYLQQIADETMGYVVTYSLGGTGPAGGMVVQVTADGFNGLEASPADITSAKWGCFGQIITTSSTSIGWGQANTTAIVNECAESPIAAKNADAYAVNGFSDWYLPSKDELNLIYLYKVPLGLNGYYMTSSQTTSVNFWQQDMADGTQFKTFDKDSASKIRAMRTF
jgi:hypothetical protein